MTTIEILKAVKMDLHISTDTQDEFLIMLIERATAAVICEGMTVRDNAEDGGIIADYAVFLYRKRREASAMPRQLRWRINNRILGEKAR